MPKVDADVASALLSLEAAPAAELLPALQSVLHEFYGVSDATVFLVDYRLTVLRALAPIGRTVTEARPVDGSTTGATFVSQRPSVTQTGAGVDIALPITVRSDRIGVLVVTVSDQPTDRQVDSLWATARAFGHAVSVATRHTDEYEQAARVQRLSLAAEMQWQILPGRGCTGPDFDLAGQLEPAYHVSGDAFDWCVAADHVTFSVHEGMGSGTAAAQATNLAVTALRNARRAGLALAEQAEMADQAIYGIYGGTHHIETLVVRFEREDRSAAVIDAGSPALFRQNDSGIRPVLLEGQLPFGRFTGTRYRAQRIPVEPGDRLIAVSDGVHSARAHSGELFGEHRLGEILSRTRHLNPAETVRRVIRELQTHYGDRGIEDDAVAVIFDSTP